MDMRIEKDSLGEVKVPSQSYWGAQTQRSLQNFKIGSQKFNRSMIWAMGVVKKAAAEANLDLGKLPKEKADLMCKACDLVIDGDLGPALSFGSLANRFWDSEQYECQ